MNRSVAPSDVARRLSGSFDRGAGRPERWRRSPICPAAEGSTAPRRSAAETGWRPHGWRSAVLGLVALAFVGSGLFQAARDAPTVDEGIGLASGITMLVDHDLRVNPEHPPLSKALAALPALVARPIVPHTAAYRSGAWFDYGDDFIRANDDAGRLRRTLFLARLVPLAEAVACAVVMHALAGRLFGADAGFLAAALWLTTPAVVGLSHFMMIDVPFTLTVLGVAFALLRFLERPGLRRAAVIGLTLGVALATRQTAVVLVAVAVAVVVGSRRREWRGAARCAGAMLLLTLVALWAVYRLIAPTGPSGPVARRFDGLVATAEHRSAVGRAVLAVPAPPEWRAGFAYLVVTSDARPASLFGQSWDGARWWFFPGSVLVKVPTGALIVLLSGPIWLLSVSRSRRRQALLAVASPAVALFLFVAVQPLDLGVRLVLPTIALWIVLGSALARIRLSTRWYGVGAAALALTQAGAFGAAHPHSLAWTPAPFRPAYRWASDSNVDFGQDAYRLRDWSRGRRPWVALAQTRGMALPAESRPLVGADLRRVTGWVAVGVTPLTELHRRELSWLRAYCPVDTIGGSILLYHFTTPPDGRPGPARPSAPCAGADRSTRRRPL